MNTLQTLARKYATGKTILVLFILTQGIYLVMLGITIPQVREYTGEMEVFDLRAQGYSTDYALELLETLGEQGRDLYLTRQIPMDLIYPGLYLVTYTLLLSYIFEHAFSDGSFMQHLVFVPVLGGVFDYLENIGIIVMLTTYPDFSSTVAQATNLFSVSKSLFTTVFFVLLIVGLVKWFLNPAGQRKPSLPNHET